MENIESGSVTLERFITLFLPEGKLVCDEELELLRVSKLIALVLGIVHQQTTPNVIFEAFYNLRYPMSAVEPLQKGEILQPYIDTNSHALYLAIDSDKLTGLVEFSKAISRQDNPVPAKFKNMLKVLQQLYTAIPKVSS